MNEKPEVNTDESAQFNPGDKYLELGQGVQRNTPQTEAKVEETPPTAPVEDKHVGDWIDTPTYTDQFVRYPQTTRLRGPMFAVFDLSSPTDNTTLSKLMDKQYPDTAPQAMIVDINKHFCEKVGNWKMLVTYNIIQYRKLLSKPIEP